MIAPSPRHDYPPDPPVHQDQVDTAHRRGLLLALAEDLLAMESIEHLVRPFTMNTWRDLSGYAKQIVSVPLVQTDGTCDWPNRTWANKFGTPMHRCGGAQALGPGDPDALSSTPPGPGPGQIYRPSPITGNVLEVFSAFVHWLVFITEAIDFDDDGMPDAAYQRLLEVDWGAGTSQPPDTLTEIPFPLGYRLGADQPVIPLALGAIELRHTPEPIVLKGMPEDGPGGTPTAAAAGITPFLASGSGSGSGGGTGSSDSSEPPGGPSGSDSSSPSSSSSSSSSPSPSDSDHSKIIRAINREGRTAFIGWCAVEAPQATIEERLEIPLRTDAPTILKLGDRPHRAWASLAGENPWQVVEAFVTKRPRKCGTIFLCAEMIGAGVGALRIEAVDDQAVRVPCTVTVLMRAAMAGAGPPWRREPDPERREASRRFHRATRAR